MAVDDARFVRWVDQGENPGELLNEAKGLTWVLEAEHLVLRLEDGRLALVSGGRDGIRFEVEGKGASRSLRLEVDGEGVRVDQILWHTHPIVTGPSDGDLEALIILGQSESIIHELGGDPDGTRIRPKRPGY